ncbi:MAG: dephospho-CoA kinase [Bacteroidales bacterium]
MMIAGLTGNIGSGKSLAADIFRVLGVPVFDADREGKNILIEPELHEKLKSLFGENIFADGKPDRQAIAAIVFHDKKKLRQLNDIIHPAVRKKFADWSHTYRHLPYVIYEAAIIFETGRAAQLDTNIVVTAPAETRIARVVQRDGVSRQQVEERMKNQWPEEKKTSLADHIIDNSGAKMLIPQVLNIHKAIVEQSGKDQSGT